MPGRNSRLSRIYIQTLGCPKNEADSRTLIRQLVAAGASVVGEPEDATHILVNTCGFIREAKEESIGAILEACGSHREKTVVVMGCLVERYRKELERGIPEVAHWFGLVDVCGSADTIARTLMGSFAREPMRSPSATIRASGSTTVGLPGAAHAYLKISDGCSGPCTFCAIPAIKGKYRSATTAEIIKEADACLAQGARELVLVGQDTAIWESDGLTLTGLIDLLAADERVCWIRVMYLQPEHVTDDFLRYMARQPKLCRYLDVPFQHSHPEVLRRMGRRGKGAEYLDLLARARGLMPDISVRSTFIVGFPGETEEQFDHLLGFVNEAEFDHAGGFVYSPEEGTPAAAERPRVPRRVAKERANRLSALLAAHAEQRHQRLIGSRVPVMIDSMDVEEPGAEMTAVGRTEGQAPEVDGVTYVEGSLPDEASPGDVVMVTVTGAMGYDLVGVCDAP